jgi:hypothetical protein
VLRGLGLVGCTQLSHPISTFYFVIPFEVRVRRQNGCLDDCGLDCEDGCKSSFRQRGDAGVLPDEEGRVLSLLPCLVLFCLVLSCLVLSCLVLSCLVLSCLVFFCFVLFCFCFVLPCVVLSCLVLCCLIQSSLVLSCLVLSCLVLACLEKCFPGCPPPFPHRYLLRRMQRLEMNVGSTSIVTS